MTQRLASGDVQDQGAVPQRFPAAGSLCERCGYSLEWLSVDQDCPECGATVRGSSPELRQGLPWQRGMGLGAWVGTSVRMVVRPGVGYRQLRVGGSNLRDRLYLASFVVGLGLAVWLGFGALGVSHARLWLVIVVTGIPVATYTEVLGVVFFSRARGLRVPFELAERVACYAAVGWVPAILLMAAAQALVDRGYLMDWWRPAWGRYTLLTDVVLSSVLFGVSILWFEMLVWLGIQKVRFANSFAVK